MECTEDGELTVLTLGEEKVREGSYNIINDYAHARSQKPGDEGHWAYAPFPNFETFSRVIIGETTDNRVPEMNYNLHLGLTTLYLESHDELKRCLGNMMDTRSVSVEEQHKQDEELLKARESLRQRTAAIHTAWNIQGVLHMWRAHCQSPKYAGRFGRSLYREILCAWKKTRDFLGEEDTVNIRWLDSWVSKFNEYYQQKEDWVQQTLSWNMIHDAGDAEFGHSSIRHWQVELNKFRYQHRSILDIASTIEGIKERMSQFRLMIKDPKSYHGWAAGNCYWQIKTEEFRILANQLMDMEFRQRLQDHPSTNTKFLELDRLALIIFKNQTIESFKEVGPSTVRADLMIETWFATFGLLLNYDMICTGYAWSVVRSTSLMDTDCFIINYQDWESKKAGWQCPVTMTNIAAFLTGLKSFIKRRADSLRKRNRKAATQLAESTAAHLNSGTGEVFPERNRMSEPPGASPRGEVGQTIPEVSGSKGKSTAPTLSSQVLAKDTTNSSAISGQESLENASSHPSMEIIATPLDSSRDTARSKTKVAQQEKRTTTPISTPPTETSNFDWFEEVIEPSVNSGSSIYGGSDLAAGRDTMEHQTPTIGTPVCNLNNIDRDRGITYASVTKTGAREVSLAGPLAPTSPTPSLPRKKISASKTLNDTPEKEDKFIGYIEPSTGPWIEVTKKKSGETPAETRNIKNPRKQLVFSVNKDDLPNAVNSLPKNKPAIGTRKIETSARMTPANKEEHASSRAKAKNTPAPTVRHNTDTNNYPHLPRKSIDTQPPKGTAAVIAIHRNASSSQQVSGVGVKQVEQVKSKGQIGQPKESNRQSHYTSSESPVSRPKKTVGSSAQDSAPVPLHSNALTKGKLEAIFDQEPGETKLNETDDPTIGSQKLKSGLSHEQGSESTLGEMPEKSEVKSGIIPPIVPSSEGTEQDSGKSHDPQQPNALRESVASRSSSISHTTTPQSQPLPKSNSIQSNEREETDSESLVDRTDSRPNDSSIGDCTLPENTLQADDCHMVHDAKENIQASKADRSPSPTPSSTPEKLKSDEYHQPRRVISGGIRDGQDIVALMDRVTHGNRAAPSLEDLANMQAAIAHSDGTNGNGLPTNGNGQHEGGISTSNCDREEYVSYTLLAKGVEGAVCDMLEEWYDPS